MIANWNIHKEVYKSEWSFFFLLFALYVGQGISYGPICLFHFVLPVYLFDQFRKGISFKSLLDKKVWPFHLLAVWILISSCWNTIDFNYLYYYSLGYAVFILLWLKKRLLEQHFMALVVFFGMLLGLDLLIGTLEFITPFRYPISRISSINHLFGRDYSIFGTGSECFDMNYVLSSPTGFHWNQNNYALVLLVFLPFLKFIRKNFLRNVLRILVLLLILAAGSRLGFIVASIITLITIIYEYQTIRTGFFPLLFLLVVYTDGLYFLPLGSKKVKEVALVSKSVFDERFPEHCYDHLNSDNSRKELALNGLELVKQHTLAGLGAGGFTNEMIRRNKAEGPDSSSVVNAHNYLMELLVDFGFFGLIPLGWIIFNFLNGLWKTYPEIKIAGILYSFALFAGTIMVSSLVYFIPVYLSFFLLYIYLNGQKKQETFS